MGPAAYPPQVTATPSPEEPGDRLPSRQPPATFATQPGPATGASPLAAPSLAKWLLIYTLLRLCILVVLTAVLLLLKMPLILAMLFAVVFAMPLSWLVFGGVRRRVNEAMAIASAHRRGERERLRAALDGREPQ